MFKMRIDSEASSHLHSSEDPDEPPSGSSAVARSKPPHNGSEKDGLIDRIKYLVTGRHHKTDNSLREVIEEYIVEPDDFNTDSVSTHERILLSNMLKLRDVSVLNVMIPRADIVAIDVDITKDDLFALLAEKQFSRFPVYSETLDDVLGTVHIKDIVANIAQGRTINLLEIMSEVPIVSPSMPILDLVLKMRQSRRHMALVVDEFGGIDGLVTIGDVIEAILGEIDDEHDTQDDPEIIDLENGSVVADARVSLEEFEERFGTILKAEEREESDTLGGLVFDLAGHVPVRGEMITHESGIIFEILEADPRKISSIKISNIPEAVDDIHAE